MNTTTPTTGFAAPSGATTGPTRRVVDAPTRMFHWLFALCFALAYMTADGERWRLVHVTLGYTLAGLLVFRLGYGLVGPRQARLSLLWHKLAGLPAWIRSLKAGDAAAVNWRQGQNLLMALAVAALLVVVAPVALSGYATYSDWGGEWLEDLHEFTGELFLWLVLGHLTLILGLSLLRRKNQALPMLNGRVQGTGPDIARHPHHVLAVSLLVAVLGFWAWQWQQGPAGLPSGKSADTDHVVSHAHDNDDD